MHLYVLRGVQVLVNLSGRGDYIQPSDWHRQNPNHLDTGYI